MEHLPPPGPIEAIETRPVLKKLTEARAALAELKGVAATIPNEQILIDTLSLQEARDSSAIENIVTTHDELYQSNYTKAAFASAAAKEVHAYAEALKKGFEAVRHKEVITINTIITIQGIIEQNDAGIRKLPGTELRNEATGDVVYTPPQDHDQIVALMRNLEAFMNDPSLYPVDPLIKMALIHHQFESIHPFYDGNGRTGRIINILYLIQEGLLHLPVLYISRYIIQRRSEYYRLLQHTRDTGEWEPWLLYMLRAVEVTARDTITIIGKIKEQMMHYKQRIRNEENNLYSQDLINNLFRHPYTKIAYLMQELQVSRQTARSYLERLVKMGLLHKVKLGRSNYYINQPLYQLLSSSMPAAAENPVKTHGPG